MKLRDLLKTDLRSLMKGKVDPPPEEDLLPEDYQPEEPMSAADLGSVWFNPVTFQYRFLSANWPGPRYFRVNTYREDLVEVMTTLSALSANNLSFIHGMNAAAREKERLMVRDRFWRYRRLGSRVVAIMLFLGILGSAVAQLSGLAYILGMFLVAYLVIMIPVTSESRHLLIFLALRDRMNRGLSLSESMRTLPRLFPGFAADMVAAAEQSGKMSTALKQLTDDTLFNFTLGQRRRGVWLYLGGVAIIQASILSFIAVKVLPVFQEVSEEFGASSLPFLTDLMLEAGDFLMYNWPEMLIGLNAFIILVGFLRLAARRSRGRRESQGILDDFLRLFAYPLALVATHAPGFRQQVAKVNLGKASLIMENLLMVGVPLPAALQSAAFSDLNPMYRDLLLRMSRRVEQGETFFDALQKSRRLLPVPASYKAFARLAETAGTLPEVMGRLGRIYRAETQTFGRVVTEGFLPVGVMAMGAVTLLVVGGCFTMLTDLTNVLLASM
jgi:type IV pilus assembly protein PilC